MKYQKAHYSTEKSGARLAPLGDHLLQSPRKMKEADTKRPASRLTSHRGDTSEADSTLSAGADLIYTLTTHGSSTSFVRLMHLSRDDSVGPMLFYLYSQ